MLQIQTVRSEILRSDSCEAGTSNCLYDLSYGSIYKNHDFFKSNPNGLQIVAYYDEVETCNPLGSSSGKFKLGCVFFTLGNIRPLYRSGLKAIFLLMVAKSSTIKINGIDSFLKPFLDDLKSLQDVGITIEVNGKRELWKGALLAFLADNLAAHELGGFKESFSFSRRFCRSCLTNKEHAQKDFREASFEVRTPASHADHCSKLGDPSMSIEYGINRRSSLESLEGFSVVNGMPHDIMHDLFEGVIPYELKLLISLYISKSYFQLDTLNYRLKAFDFSHNEIKDKPAPIQDCSKLRQSASQMWLLARIFPLLVGDLIPRDDPNWVCFLKLLKICDICTAPVLSEDTAAFLELLIEEHHAEFTRLYPSMSIIPKMHFMVHFPQQILNYGPLVHTWTMRHEAKLRIIKRAARVSNFKNVCQTVAKRHQHLLCYYMHSNSLLVKAIKTGLSKPYCITAELQLLLRDYCESLLFTTSFVTYNGITFKPNDFVLFSYDRLEPTFSKISTILKVGDEAVIFVLNKFITEYHDTHYHAFCIREHPNPIESLHVCNVRNLEYNIVYHARQTFGVEEQLYIQLKTHIETES